MDPFLSLMLQTSVDFASSYVYSSRSLLFLFFPCFPRSFLTAAPYLLVFIVCYVTAFVSFPSNFSFHFTDLFSYFLFCLHHSLFCFSWFSFCFSLFISSSLTSFHFSLPLFLSSFSFLSNKYWVSQGATAPLVIPVQTP